MKNLINRSGKSSTRSLAPKSQSTPIKTQIPVTPSSDRQTLKEVHKENISPIRRPSTTLLETNEISAPKCTSDSWSSNNTSSSSSTSFKTIEQHDYKPKYKKRKIRSKCDSIMDEINNVCMKNGEELSSVLARCCLLDRGSLPEDSKQVLRDIFEEVEEKLGTKKTLQELVPEEIMKHHMKEMTVPDWQLLLLKLSIPISDDGWQKLLNFTEIGKNGRSSRAQILLSKNSIKAVKGMILAKIEDLFSVIPTHDVTIPGYLVSLESVICWQIRELRLHGNHSQSIELNLKLDGRPFGGRNQVLVCVIPSKTVHWSNHSCKSFCPLALANCKENRENLIQLICKLNQEKEVIKKCGIQVDGILYTVTFKVTLDLKALYLLLQKDDDEDFELGGKGLTVEFCFICQALRGCDCDIGPNTVCLEHFSQTKANIGSFQGIRDDLTFLLEEDISTVNLCALHCELRNTEHLIACLGLQCHRVGTIKKCNEILSNYGPETTGDRIGVKLKQGQQTAITKQNIYVKSFSGNTERGILRNIEEIVTDSLPPEVMEKEFANQDVAKEYLLNKISFCCQQIKHYQYLKRKGIFVRDFGKYQEEIQLLNSEIGKVIDEHLSMWEKKKEEICSLLRKCTKRNASQLSSYTAKVFMEFFLKVFTSWREIAMVMRTEVFGVDEQHKVDIFDLKCKEWGFLLREMFGSSLGTGDYGHMTIEHASMLLRQFGSLREYSNQSIESSHSLQRQLYSKATSHDRHGYTSSIKQIVLHFYAERLLFLRMCFRRAMECNSKGTPFYFGGCGWTLGYSKSITWSPQEKVWIAEINSLFTMIFGEDFLEYSCDKDTKVVEVAPESLPTYIYNHAEREASLTPLSTAAKPVAVSKTKISTQNITAKKSQPVTKLPTVNSTTTSINTVPTILYPDLRQCVKSDLTRREISQLHLPPLIRLSHQDLEIVQSPVRYTNPMLIAARPQKDIIKRCKSLLQSPVSVNNSTTIDSDSDDDDDFGVQVGGLGVFNKYALDIWEKAAYASDVASDVREESNWLSSGRRRSILTATEVSSIEATLFDTKPNELFLSIGNIIADTHDLTSLVGERSLVGFVIDIACLKYNPPNKNATLYLPTFCEQWTSGTTDNEGDEEFLKNKVKEYVGESSMQDLSWILVPLHLSGSHWGVLAINVKRKTIFYDDGLHWKPPGHLASMTTKLLRSLHSLSNKKNDFDCSNWNLSQAIRYFGMPDQPSNSNSCGMGVILAIHSIMDRPLVPMPQFDWTYDDMFKHRALLLKQFIEWK